MVLVGTHLTWNLMLLLTEGMADQYSLEIFPSGLQLFMTVATGRCIRLLQYLHTRGQDIKLRQNADDRLEEKPTGIISLRSDIRDTYV